MEEIWKPLPDFDKRYTISSFGKIRNILTNKLLLGSIRHGYLGYTLKNNQDKIVTFGAHILVAKTFIPNPDNKPIVNHIDENKCNAHADNLEWVTYKENTNYGKCKDKIGEIHQNPVCEYNLHGNLIRIWKSPVFVSKIYPIGVRAIQLAAKLGGLSNTCYGRQWRYFKDTHGEDIEPVSTTRSLRYNNFVSYDFIIPIDYLYKTPYNSQFTKYIFYIDKLLVNDYLTPTQRKHLTEIQQYFQSLIKKVDKT